MRLRLILLALGTFAIGTGSFVFAGLLGAVAEDRRVSVGAAGQGTPRLKPGRHEALIVARDGEGLTANRIWGFRIRR